MLPISSAKEQSTNCWKKRRATAVCVKDCCQIRMKMTHIYVVVPLVKLVTTYVPEQIEIEINNGNSRSSPSLCLAFVVVSKTIRNSKGYILCASMTNT